jgi:GntR family transcriptional regulator / MocR family aminotransferase
MKKQIWPITRVSVEFLAVVAGGCPGVQFPTGAVMTPGRRLALIAWAQERRALVIKDDYDAEFRYDRTPIGAVQGLDPREEGRSCRDRLQDPGPRRAAGLDRRPRRPRRAVGDPQVRGRLRITSPRPARPRLPALDGEYERHIAAARRAYRHRRHLLIRALAATLPGLQVRGAAAGMQLFLQLPDDTDAALAQAAAAQGINIALTTAPCAKPAARPARRFLPPLRTQDPARRWRSGAVLTHAGALPPA